MALITCDQQTVYIEDPSCVDNPTNEEISWKTAVKVNNFYPNNNAHPVSDIIYYYSSADSEKKNYFYNTFNVNELKTIYESKEFLAHPKG